MRWNSAPTLVERQRENLTERLRREFGLFLSDDEEQERARKQGEQFLDLHRLTVALAAVVNVFCALNYIRIDMGLRGGGNDMCYLYNIWTDCFQNPF